MAHLASEVVTRHRHFRALGDPEVTGQSCLEVPANFGLATSFPSRELDKSDAAQTLEQLGLTPSGVLLCRDLDD